MKNYLQSFRVCVPLTSQGPCLDGSWFVVSTEANSDTGLAEGTCAERGCEKEDEVSLRGGGECHKIGSISACQAGMELLVDPFGKGLNLFNFGTTQRKKEN